MEGLKEELDTLIPLCPHALPHYSLLSLCGMWNVTFLVFRPRCKVQRCNDDRVDYS
jgi:hypothetical protein